MIYPIIAYGDSVLRKKAADISKDMPGLSQLIADMFDTMKHSSGVGLAAPQIGMSIRLFVIDASVFAEDEDATEEEKTLINFKKVFINAQIQEEFGEKWDFNEGCLSIPKVREDVSRHQSLTITYFDEQFQQHTETFSGIAARIIQHEYDHIEGKLFIDHINPIRRRMLSRDLENISKGNIKTDYKMKFSAKKKGR